MRFCSVPSGEPSPTLCDPVFHHTCRVQQVGAAIPMHGQVFSGRLVTSCRGDMLGYVMRRAVTATARS